MSEAELHFIRARLRGGQLSKARRGELPMPLPVGLVTDPTGKVVLDPDAGVQHAIRHLFATFARTGSARAVVQAFNGEGLLFPARVRFGPHKGELAWMPLKHWRVLRTLHNPRYAGAFVYGRRRERKNANGKTFHETLPREQWTALIPDAHPGYITWDTFEHNQTLLAANAQAYGLERSAGPAREGPALLQGLAICARCGRRMTVRYHQRRGVAVPDYQCVGESIQAGAPRCLTVPGGGVDAAIGQLLLDTVTPLALEVALTVQAELEARADEADALRRSHVERARHHADLARRRYLAVDPDNRLVADSLEADWNDGLRQLHTAQDDYERAAASAIALSDEHKVRIRALAADFPALWSDPATPQRERKRMARLLIDDVTLAKTDRIHLHVRFRGGQTTSLTIPIPPTGWKARQTDPDTFALLDRLLDDHTDAEIADALNAGGHRSGDRPAVHPPDRVAPTPHTSPAQPRPTAAGPRPADDRARSPTASTSHRATIKDWQHAGLLVSHKANDKNERLYEPPTPGDPRLIKRMGSRLAKRVLIEPTPGGAV